MAVIVDLEAHEAIAVTGREDVIIRDPGVTEISQEAIERLVAAAAQDSVVATVSALRRETVVAPVPDPKRPAISSPVAGLVLITRPTLDLIPDARDLADLAARASALGLVHVLAEDATVAPAGDAPAVKAPRHALDRALAAVERQATRMTVTVDGRVLGPSRAGTQVHALELILALARTGAAELRVIVAHDLADDVRAAFAAEPSITTVSYEEAAHGGLTPTDIVHRPSQIFDDGDLRLVHPLGRRMVVTQQDLIAFRSEAINAVPDLWGPLRMATRLALAVADHVVFFTEASRQDALRDDLVSADRSSVVGIGVDHRAAHATEPAPPAGIDPGERFLLTLGSDWPHKNLPFAHRLGEHLGIRVLGAGSGAELGQVTEAEKAWLLRHAAAVVYPTLYEGFGLVPFEAGAAGVPCLFAPVSTLAELFPSELATLVPWDVEASAAAVRPLLEPGPTRDAHVSGLRAAAAGHSWDACARSLLDVYRRTLAAPLPERETAQADLYDALDELNRAGRLRGAQDEAHRRAAAELESIGHDGLALVGRHGVLDETDQRTILAIFNRPPLRRAFRAAYRAARRGA